MIIIFSHSQDTFTGSEKRAVWKRMRDTEVKAKLNMDEMPLAALHKVSTHTHTRTQASSDSSLAQREE